MSRISGIVDVGRASLALSRPGIDPRSWHVLAFVTAVGLDEEGPIVDVLLMPDRTPETARVGAEYAGPNFGQFSPQLEVDDEVLVAFPNGDPNEGAVVIRRLWSKSDPVPSAALANPQDWTLVAKEGTNVKLAVSEGGELRLGGVDASQAVVLGSTYRSAEDTLLDALDVFTTALDTAFKGTAATAEIKATFTSASAAFKLAISNFKSGASSYLSSKVKAE